MINFSAAAAAALSSPPGGALLSANGSGDELVEPSPP